ncbi:uncharacterized protein LOC111689833 [Lucilia cuprina]|uniref:uncharacterized protein LOC111689833 n=1 Tax=Lucilia cuprina TaxID=7375 RepID=UPI001F062479|nr:uncharacterized protein LOC111689833 [Lucilia cuprina]
MRWNNSSDDIPMTTKEDSVNDETHFLDLNDDCLLEILKYLNIHETFTLLGGVCKRIDDIIYERLALIKHLTINLRDPPAFTTQQLEIIGRNLKSLYISAGYSLSSPLTLNYLQPICCQGSLQFLTLHYVQFDESYQKCLMKVAAQLEFLDLSYCQLTDDLLQPILEKCSNLRALTIFGNYNLKCTSLAALKSRELKELKVEQNSNCKPEIEKFIKKNPEVTVTIFAIGFLGHINSKAYHE